MLAVLALSATLASSPASCEALKSLTLPNTTIVAAEMKADLLVIGRGAADEDGGRLAANAYAIIRQSPCPVISVP